MKYIIANWKMNPQTEKEAVSLLKTVISGTKKVKRTKVIICAPYLFLGHLAAMVRSNKNVFIGAQNSFWECAGDYTGKISPMMLRNLGVRHVIIGHSEKRCFGETNEDVNRKIGSLLKLGMKVIVCMGESERDETGEYLKFLNRQVVESFKGIQRKFLKNVIIAYEPVWAVGKKAASVASPLAVADTLLYLRKVIVEIAGRDIGMKIPVLYGGSVNPDNAGGFLNEAGAGGLLVGRASLDGEKFLKIIKKAEERI